MQGNTSIKASGKAPVSRQSSVSSEDENIDGADQMTLQAESLRIFLVEDSPVIRDLIIEDLSGIAGVLLVGTAETEKQAIEDLSEIECDVMIVDIQLRQGNGINLLRALAERSLQEDCLKLVLSNHVSGTYRRLCAQYGVRYFFDKTSEFPHLRSMIARLRVGAGTH